MGRSTDEADPGPRRSEAASIVSASNCKQIKAVRRVVQPAGLRQAPRALSPGPLASGGPTASRPDIDRQRHHDAGDPAVIRPFLKSVF